MMLLTRFLKFSSMCLRPLTIKNPLFCRTSYSSECGGVVELPKYITPQEEYITVPCGKCDDCRNVYFNSLLQRCIVESLTSYMYFVTLTYDNDHIPSLTLPSGKTVYYTEYSDIQNLFKRFRRNNILDRDFRYICVNEYGDTFNRPHSHLLIFVAKRDDDTTFTPYHIERILKSNIKRFYAFNIGTRKKPIYESLFTHVERYINGRLHTNYFVKYVEEKSDVSMYVPSNSNDDDTYVKTIRYLIGYLNKGSRFDKIVEEEISKLQPCDCLIPKLRRILSSRCRFSKGLGCGFIDGQKHYLPRISVRTSLNRVLYTELVDSLPRTFNEFVELFPHMLHELDLFVLSCPYQHYKSFTEMSRKFTADDMYHHLLLVKYFPEYVSTMYDRYFRRSRIVPTVSYFFDNVSTSYSLPVVRTTDFERSYTFDWLRRSVEDGISAGVPYLSFKMTSNRTFTALCKYYKERVCFIEDYIRMFQSVGCSSYEEWQALFEHEKNLRKTNISNGNKLKYEKNSENILHFQKNCVDLHRNKRGEDLYRSMLSNCK